MKAIHLHTCGVHDPHEAALIEMCIRFAEGVNDVASIRTLDLISVLYDERQTDPRQIVESVKSIGFDAREYALPHEFACAS